MPKKDNKKNLSSFIDKGYARKLFYEAARKISPRTWYLPHFGVRNPSKPKKLRIVFDAAAVVDCTEFDVSDRPRSISILTCHTP